MRRKILVGLMALVVVPVIVSAGVWPFGKAKPYNLGSDPTIQGMVALEDGLGFVSVEKYDRDNAELTIKVLSGSVSLEADSDDADSTCIVREPIALRPSQTCSLWGKDEAKKREHHLRISWSYENKKGIRVVVLYVKKATLKLAK